MNAPLTPLEPSRRDADARRSAARELAAIEAELRTLEVPSGGPRGGLAKGLEVVPATPCSEPWRAMVGDDRIRRCSRCQRDVLELGGLRLDEVEALLAERGLPRCARFHRREDGTLLAEDCPVGRPRQLANRVLVAIAVAVGLATLTAFFVSRLASLDDLDVVAPAPAPAP